MTQTSSFSAWAVCPACLQKLIAQGMTRSEATQYLLRQREVTRAR